ncbi:MAG: hypothetical protein M3P26_12425 [Gemmatimonadota bacterium]|nr:hypothetical protein [Gemmatimonadota bacterium]
MSKTRLRLRLEDMSESELQEIRFFGALQSDPHTVTFAATPEEVTRAVDILEQRGELNTQI